MANRLRFQGRAETFRHAFRGIGEMLRTEANARVHAGATLIVVVAGFAAGIDRVEWMLLILTIAAVWSLEAVNTAIEAVCDAVSTDHHPEIQKAKDVAAGAVLIAAFASIVVAALIFGKRIITLVTS